MQSISNQLAKHAYTFDAHDIDGWVSLSTDDGHFEVRKNGTDGPLLRLQGAEQLSALLPLRQPYSTT